MSDVTKQSLPLQPEQQLAGLQQAFTEFKNSGTLQHFESTSRVIRRIAHEIRNPLTNISLATEQLKMLGSENDEMMMMLEMVKRNSN
ncbi:MAG: hypothetical protein C4308_06570 [Chitinophagaceae bacterium]